MKKMEKIKAFTLAETLITLMVIGVIAVMTVPTLKEHSDEVKYVTAAKKAYSTVSSSTTAIEVRHTESNFWNFGDAKTIRWYSEVVNAIPNPVPSESSWDIVSIGGSSAGTFTPSLWLADGMAWQIGSSGECGKCGQVLVDTNGAQQPNTIGIDVHGFLIGNKSGKSADFGVFPMGDGQNSDNATYACTSYAVQHGEMPWFREVGKYSSCASFVGQ